MFPIPMPSVHINCAEHGYNAVYTHPHCRSCYATLALPFHGWYHRILRIRRRRSRNHFAACCCYYPSRSHICQWWFLLTILSCQTGWKTCINGMMTWFYSCSLVQDKCLCCGVGEWRDAGWTLGRTF